MNVVITGSEGQKLRLEHLDQQQIVVVSSVASPPGSLIDVACAGGKFAIKVQSCRKLADGEPAFRIQGRPVNLSRHLRQTLTPPT